MAECERCESLLERLKDALECKRSHQQAAGRLAKRNSDLKAEIGFLEDRILELRERLKISI